MSARNLLVPIMGLVEQSLLEFFDPAPTPPSAPPLGGGTTTVWQLAGQQVSPPPWAGPEGEVIGDCSMPYLWTRLVSRWRQGQSQNQTASSVVVPKCDRARGVTIEAGISRCYPLDGSPDLLAQHAQIQWDDSWRVDLALCAAMRAVEEANLAQETGVGVGEPEGPAGMVLTWVQSAYILFY